MSCCVDLELPIDDDYSVAESDEDKVIQPKNKNVASEKKKRLNVSYNNATPLFKAIEKQQWESILMFLSTSKWSNSFFMSNTDHFKNPTPSIQCQTWVTCYSRTTKEVEWSQLPIHAAISYAAPAVVIQKLVAAFPDSLKEFDHEGMLPVHLAFGFALPDAVLSLLLKSYPESAQARGPGGRLPHQCCELGQNKIRGEVLGFIAEQTSDLARNDQEEFYKVYIKETMKKLEMDDTVVSMEKDLKDLILELIEDRKQFQELKLRIKRATENKASDENAKLKSIKSPKGKSPKNTSQKLMIDTKTTADDVKNMALSDNAPLSPIQSTRNYIETPTKSKPDGRKSHTPSKTSRSTKYSSKFTNQDVQ